MHFPQPPSTFLNFSVLEGQLGWPTRLALAQPQLLTAHSQTEVATLITKKKVAEK